MRHLTFKVAPLIKYLVIVAIPLMTSCNLKRFCTNRFPLEVVTVIDTITHPVYVEISLPADTLILTDTIYLPAPENSLEPFIHTLKNEYAISRCGWTDGRLLHELEIIETILTDTVYVELPQETKYVIQREKFVPKFYVFTFYFFFIVLGLVLFKLVLRR